MWLLLLATLVARGRELHPAAHVPTAADRAAGDQVLAQLRSAPGEVLIPFHPFYAHLAGKRTYLHRMGLWDVRGTAAGPVRGLVGALQQQQFSRIVFDDKVEQTWSDWPDVLLRYRIAERIRGPRTLEGAQAPPPLVLEALPPPPALPRLGPIFWLAAGLLMIASIVKFLGHDHESVPQSVPQSVGSDAGHHDEHGASH